MDAPHPKIFVLKLSKFRSILLSCPEEFRLFAFLVFLLPAILFMKSLPVL
jgi:hypothetical protein